MNISDVYESNRKLIRRLNAISSRILDNFNKMCELEVKGLKDSLEYRKYYERYLLVKSIEDDYYKSLNINMNKFDKLLSFTPERVLNVDDIIHYLSMNDYSNITYVRVLQRLIHELCKQDDLCVCDPESNDYIAFLAMKESGSDLRYIEFNKVTKEFYKKLFISYMYLLDKEKPSLMEVKAKYNLSYIYFELEEELFKEKDSFLYHLGNDILSLKLGVDEANIHNIFNLLAYVNIMDACNGYMSTSGDNMLFGNLMKTYLMLIDSEQYKFMVDKINTRIKDLKINNAKLYKVLNDSKEQRSKVRVLSLSKGE